MENAEHVTSKVVNKKNKPKLKDLKDKVDEFENRLQQKVDELRRDIKEIEESNLISPVKASEILGISIEAVRARASRGTLTKRNADGSKKITNRRTEIFFDEQEVRNKI